MYNGRGLFAELCLRALRWKGMKRFEIYAIPGAHSQHCTAEFKGRGGDSFTRLHTHTHTRTHTHPHTHIGLTAVERKAGG